MDKTYWNNKRVLVTGFEGFLGSHLSRKLVALEADVIGLDIQVMRKTTILTPGDYESIKVIKGDVANGPLLKKIIKNNKVQVVFHLAAEALVRTGYAAPLKAFQSNIAGTWSLLEACRFAGNLEAILVASSDKSYGAHPRLPYKEDFSLKGCYPYDVSKSCADLLASTYFHTYGLPVAITRCGNIYGPGDYNFSRIIPDAARCLILDKTLQIRSDGKFVRDYIYVEDIVAGYLRIAECIKSKKALGEAFNLSDEDPISVLKLVKEINRLNLYGKKLRYRILNMAKYEIKKQYLSSAKARRMLGWKPKMKRSEGLRRTLAWVRENKSFLPRGG